MLHVISLAAASRSLRCSEASAALGRICEFIEALQQYCWSYESTALCNTCMLSVAIALWTEINGNLALYIEVGIGNVDTISRRICSFACYGRGSQDIKGNEASRCQIFVEIDYWRTHVI